MRQEHAYPETNLAWRIYYNHYFSTDIPSLAGLSNIFIFLPANISSAGWWTSFGQYENMISLWSKELPLTKNPARDVILVTPRYAGLI